MTKTTASYLDLPEAELSDRVEALSGMASPCRLCPRGCWARRSEGELGYCGTGFGPVVSSAHPHFGEEGPISGSKGSGTIFFARCNLGCVFCQNADISRRGSGTPISVEGLAGAMLALQDGGCHNINLVTPTHQVQAIVAALEIARADGLQIPLVYNTGAYDEVETLKVLDGIIDIYMPDLKFTDTKVAGELADAPDYPERAMAAILEMHRQVGDLVLDRNGVAVRGLLVRHLVLPHGLAGSAAAFHFLSTRVGPDTYVNVMSQYRPCDRAVGMPRIGDRLSQAEYLEAVALARSAGLTRLD